MGGLKVSQVLIGVAFLLILAGNRWAGYIASPIPGIPLPEFLILVSLLFAALNWRESTQLRSWVFWTYGAIITYVLLILAPEFLVVPHKDRYLALRDAAPFLYLTLVPALAIAFRSISPTVGINVVRFATGIAAFGSLLVHFGLITPFPSSLLMSDFATVFEYRSDLTGAALAIGMVAWGGWKYQQVKSQPLVQLTFIGTAGLVVTSRSGLVAILVAVFVVGYQQRQWMRGLLLAGACLMILVLTIYVPIGGILTGSTDSRVAPTVGADVPAQSPEMLMESGIPEVSPEVNIPSVDITRIGTVMARLNTWADVITGMSENGTWLIGGSAGSDYLYELCTGIAVAPETVRAEFNDPKCAVDDYGPEPVVRDPHNWALNIGVTHGIVGVILFSFVLGYTLWRGRGSEIYLLAGWVIGFFLVTGFTFLISAGYALLPMSVGAAWIVSRVGFRPSDATQSQE